MNDMALHPLAGKPAPKEILIDKAALESAYFSNRPDAGVASQRVSFGTSGHRGTSLNTSFTETHILAIAQAVCEYRTAQGYTGPLFLGMDTHALSAVAQESALAVLAANGVETVVQQGGGFTPTPVISRAILQYNRGRHSGLADGLIITPSHNPPADGGIKYNPPNGGPADTDVTSWIEARANELLPAIERPAGGKRDSIREIDYRPAYIRDLPSVLDMEAIAQSGLRIGIDPLGGAAVHYWEMVAERFGLNITVVNPATDAAFSFMTVDHDGKIRMDCSSQYAMAGLVGLKDKFDIAFGNDPDSDRHGIVTPSAGLMNPNHYLCTAIRYLLTHRPGWGSHLRIGKTLVSSSLIDRVAESLGREVDEVPVGFKWFVQGLHEGSLCFGGEESAGASFLRRDGTAWATDKDGLILGLLACEMTARTGKDPGRHYAEITHQFGESYYTRIDTAATPEQKAKLSRLAPTNVTDTTLAGDAITAKLTAAPGNGALIGGLKVTTAKGWFAARPSGTENIYKLYAESLAGAEHLERIVGEAKELVGRAL